jgi:hypothetical protein
MERKWARQPPENDSYDFDIQQDDDFSFSSPQETTDPRRSTIGRSASFNTRNSYTTASNASTMRRTSIEERAKEILQRAKSATNPTTTTNTNNNNNAPKNSGSFEESETESSLQANYAALLEGITIPDNKNNKNNKNNDSAKNASNNNDNNMQNAFSPKYELGMSRRKSGLDISSPGNDSPFSPGIDSFEISAADLEVGAIAAKKMKEKTGDRRRRMSFDQPNFRDKDGLQSFVKMSGDSPDPAKTRKSVGGSHGMEMGSALSSIQRSYSFGHDPDLDFKTFNNNNHHQPDSRGLGNLGSGTGIGGGVKKYYSSMERSDDEIYRMLNVTTVSAILIIYYYRI